jgi:hypothetical protein
MISIATVLLLAATAVRASSPADIVGGLFDIDPWLAEFEKVVGPVHRDRSIWEEAVGPLHRDHPSGPIAHLDLVFSIDAYHFDPQQEENVELASWSILFRGTADATRKRLRPRFGEGIALDFAPGRPRRFGDYYLTTLSDDRFELSWFAEEPEWAVPERSPAAERALVDRIIAFLQAGVDDAAIEAAFGKLEPQPRTSLMAAFGGDWRVQASHGKDRRADWVAIGVRGKPLDATRLIVSLGLREPGMIATDVHLSGPYLVDLATGKPPIVDGYRVSVELDRNQLESVPAKRPGTAAWRVKAWRVRSVTLTHDW